VGPEQTIQRAILEYLNWKHIFCWKVTTTGIYVQARNTWIPNQAPGVSDILGVLKGGRLLAIEVKSPKGKVSPSQQKFIESINQAGGLAFVARSVEEVEKTVSVELQRTKLSKSQSQLG
jgi:penicillin-binding protein-related factor A (putative recombinase)